MLSIRCVEICMYECIVPYMCERDGGQEVCMADRSRGPLCFPLPHPSGSVTFAPFSFLFLCLLLSPRWYQLPLLPVSADLGECEPADGELCWLRRCHPRWGGGSFRMRGKRPPLDASWRSGKFKRGGKLRKLWHMLFLWCWNDEKRGWEGESCVR